MEGTEEKKMKEDKGKGKKPQHTAAQSSQKAKKAPLKTKEKGPGKCQLFVELLKNSPGGIDWETVKAQKWNDAKTTYPGTFSKLRKAGEAFKKDGKLFYGKPPKEVKGNGKEKTS
jgi:hypothetical protein